MKIGLDLDGVVFDFHKPFVDEINRRYGKNLRVEDWTDYNFTNSGLTIEELWQLVESVSKSGGFCDLDLIEGAVENLEEISKNNSIHVITHRLYRAKQDAVALLEDYNVPYDSISFTGEKDRTGKILELDLAIDDTPKMCLKYQGAGIHPLLFHQPWNKYFEFPCKVKNWYEAAETIERLNEKIRQK